MNDIHERRQYMVEWRKREKLAANKSSGSGNIAPPTYRAQLARERLAQSAAACTGAAKFNPAGE